MNKIVTSYKISQTFVKLIIMENRMCKVEWLSMFKIFDFYRGE